jgi:y4mF family transcriptional regulator
LSNSLTGRIFPDRERQGMSPQQIGQLVRGVRRAQGLRQDQLAAAAGVGVRFLVEVERGKPTARLGKVLAVLDALGCRLRIELPPDVDEVQVGR